MGAVEALPLAGDVDEPPRVDHVIGDVEDVALPEFLSPNGPGELVVGAARYDTAAEPIQGMGIDDAAQGARREDIACLFVEGIGRARRDAVRFLQSLRPRFGHIGDDDLGAGLDEPPHQLRADLAGTLDGNAASREALRSVDMR